MERRKFLIGAGALASGSAAAVGTGAFTSVEANRNADIQVANDSGALLTFDSSDNLNGDYVVERDDGIVLDISSDNGNILGNGVNDDATTFLRDLFDIQNQGSTDVIVYAEFSGSGSGKPGFAEFPEYSEPDAADPVPGPTEPTTGIGGAPGSGGNTFTAPSVGEFQVAIPERLYLKPGDTLGEVGTVIDTTGDSEPFDGTMTFNAVAVDTVNEITGVEKPDSETVDIQTSF